MAATIPAELDGVVRPGTWWSSSPPAPIAATPTPSCGRCSVTRTVDTVRIVNHDARDRAQLTWMATSAISSRLGSAAGVEERATS
jgi:hypothetical protein